MIPRWKATPYFTLSRPVSSCLTLTAPLLTLILPFAKSVETLCGSATNAFMNIVALH